MYSGKKRQKQSSAKKLVILAAVLVVCIGVVCKIVQQQITLSRYDDLAEEYKQKIAEAQLENQKLEDEKKQADTDEYIQRAARDKLGLVKPNERVFVDISQ